MNEKDSKDSLESSRFKPHRLFAGGATPLPNVLADALLPGLSGTETKLLLIVLRQTWGWRDPRTGQPKERDWLSQSQLKRRTGRASAALASAIDSLVQKGLLIVEAEDGRPLPTPQERRRQRGHLFYRLGPVLTQPTQTDATAERESELAAKLEFAKGDRIGGESEHAQANTTTNTLNINKRNNSRIWKRKHERERELEASTEENKLTPAQRESIQESKRQIRDRLANIAPPPGRQQRVSVVQD